MKKYNILFVLILVFLTGCSLTSNIAEEPELSLEIIRETSVEIENTDLISGNPMPLLVEESDKPTVVVDVDLESYLQGINGCAVLYTPAESEYILYNPQLCDDQSSPCSTFKIVSSIIGLETGIIDPENSVFQWNGTRYWKADWNQDIGFQDAFKSSCIWYFREVINSVGKDKVKDFLSQLEYGNCDITDWNGFQNTNNNSDDLRGFWVESSLEISPKNQTEVMEAIFTSNIYDKDNISLLKQAMLLENDNDLLKIYGKTGMGVANGLCIDAWFVGMAEVEETTTYFAVRLDDPNNEETSSTKAKEIAVNILNDYFITYVKNNYYDNN